MPNPSVLGSVSSNSAVTEGTTLTVSHTVSAGPNRILIVVTCMEGTTSEAGVTGVTWDGNAMTEIAGASGNADEGANRAQIKFWYYLNPEVKTADVVLTRDSSADFEERALAAITVQNARQEAPYLSGKTSDIGSPTSISTTLVTTADGSLLLDGVTINTSSAITADSGQTDLANIVQGGGSMFSFGASSESKAIAGSETLGWSFVAQGRAQHGVVAIRPAPPSAAQLVNGGSVNKPEGLIG